MRAVGILGATLSALLLAGSAWAGEEAYGAVHAIADPTAGWNETWNEVLIDICVIGAIFLVIAAWMLYKFRATTPGQVGTAKPLSLELALAWTLIPTALFMADDFLLAAKGWTLWNVQRTVPANATEIKVTAQQWSFEFDYGNGYKTGELVVPVGQPVVLRMTAVDVIHSFGLIEYRLKEDILPGRITHIWFYPDKPVETFVTCVEFCGDGHSIMNAPVRAIPKADWEAWVAAKGKKAALRAPRFAALTQTATHN